MQEVYYILIKQIIKNTNQGDKNMTKPSVYHSQGYTRELMNRVRGKFDSEICSVLKKIK